MYKTILKLAKEDLEIRQKLINKLAGRIHNDKLPFSVQIRSTGPVEEENLYVVYMSGRVSFPLMNWSEKFYLHINEDKITDLWINNMKKVKEDTFWWNFFEYLQNENLLVE